MAYLHSLESLTRIVSLDRAAYLAKVGDLSAVFGDLFAELRATFALLWNGYEGMNPNLDLRRVFPDLAQK
eukprot:753676-Hanusia_phi.AAC.18